MMSVVALLRALKESSDKQGFLNLLLFLILGLLLWWICGTESTCLAGDAFLGQEDFLEEGMATHSSIPAWRIP